MLQRQADLGVIVVTAFASIESAVDAVKRGAVDYIPKPFTPDQIRLTANRVVEAQRLQATAGRAATGARRKRRAVALRVARARPFGSFSKSPLVRRRPTRSCLIRGESGTGKNVLARWLRANSPRAEAPFATVNCPALSGDLMTSALFGHRKGAFTGAIADVAGKVQEAEGGTLFLDEVGELTAEAQARLLRFLNDRTYERLGEARERQADVRLIAATNRDLEAEVRTGRFREDLFYRLNVITLTLPPLRERPEDVLLLAHHYLALFSRKQGRPSLRFRADAEQAMLAHGWPGNLRELRNAVERAVILAPQRGAHARRSRPQDETRRSIRNGQVDRRARVGAPVSLAALEREHIARIVAQSPSRRRRRADARHRRDDAATQAQAIWSRCLDMTRLGLRLRFGIAAVCWSARP